jgi:hypothetical protein
MEQAQTHAIYDTDPCNMTSTPMKPASYKPLRTIINTKVSSIENKIRVQQEWEKLQADMDQAKHEAVDMPTCEHELPLLRCQQCCEALAKETI